MLEVLALELFTPDEAERLYLKATERLTQIEKERSVLDEEAGRTFKLLTVLEDFVPRLGRTRPGAISSRAEGGITGVLSVLSDSERFMSVQNITRELKAHGWGLDSNDPEAAVRATLRRLHDKGSVRRRRVGRTIEYRLRKDHAEGAS